jgi:hypothetical protein
MMLEAFSAQLSDSLFFQATAFPSFNTAQLAK